MRTCNEQFARAHFLTIKDGALDHDSNENDYVHDHDYDVYDQDQNEYDECECERTMSNLNELTF